MAKGTIRIKMLASHTNPTGTWNEGVIYDVEAATARQWISKGFAIEVKE